MADFHSQQLLQQKTFRSICTNVALQDKLAPKCTICNPALKQGQSPSFPACAATGGQQGISFRISRVIRTLCGETSGVGPELVCKTPPGGPRCRGRVPFCLIEPSGWVWGSAGRKASALNLSPACVALNRGPAEPRCPPPLAPCEVQRANWPLLGVGFLIFFFFCTYTHTHTAEVSGG